MSTWLKEHARPVVADDDFPAQAIPLKLATTAGLLGLLLGVTATAIGVLLSWWLVLPYLLAMVWLLVPEGQVAAWRQGRKAPHVAMLAASEVPSVEASTREEPEPATSANPDVKGAASGAVALKAKPKRKRTTRKSRAVAEAAEPVAATWVQVGPGRFVRVEIAEPPAESPVADAADEAPRPPSEPEDPAIVEVVEPCALEGVDEALEPCAIEEVDPLPMHADEPEDLERPEPALPLGDFEGVECLVEEIEAPELESESEDGDEPRNISQDDPLAC